MRHLLELLLLPPCSGALLLLAALLLRRRLPRTARILGLAAGAWLWLAALPPHQPTQTAVPSAAAATGDADNA